MGVAGKPLAIDGTGVAPTIGEAMTHRRSRTSATALLTIIVSLALCAVAWAQGSDEPTTSDEPAMQGQGPGNGEEDGQEVSGSGTGGSDARNGRDDMNCDDFRFQEDAQEFFERQGGLQGGDEDKLDEDPGEDDGQACEDLPSRDEGGSTGGEDFDDDTPSGGVASGYGRLRRARRPPRMAGRRSACSSAVPCSPCA